MPSKKKRKIQKRNEAEEALVFIAIRMSEAAYRVGNEQRADEDARRKIPELKVISEQASAFRNLLRRQKEFSEVFREFAADEEKKVDLEYVRDASNILMRKFINFLFPTKFYEEKDRLTSSSPPFFQLVEFASSVKRNFLSQQD